ncbi:GNAT family N-acetyltransferase [Demequina sp. NBRC 110052]|uniref:GNAT family N-acetyltransferase n=1 Tax=Demequina sp. NBRC 110052 TaxID=1570341 RepID=UPI0009FE1A9C|nr:GNAT family N-acetyltransferase [Demequina sp. NBRC 110052]
MNSQEADRSLEVRRVDERQRYEILVAGELAGFAEFRERGDRMIFTHTEVDASYEGQGLASRLVAEAIDDAVKRDRVIVPACPYVARWLTRHDVPGARIEST